MLHSLPTGMECVLLRGSWVDEKILGQVANPLNGRCGIEFTVNRFSVRELNRFRQPFTPAFLRKWILKPIRSRLFAEIRSFDRPSVCPSAAGGALMQLR